MFGFGFLFAGALGSLAVVGWPIYLHFRNRNKKRIQVVPSLRLFGFERKKTRQIRIEQLLLLLARVMFVVGMGLLLSQPFWETHLNLPLPPAAGEGNADQVLAVIIDDTISSMHEKDGQTRLRYAKSRLKGIISKLPSNCMVRFIPLSCPYPTRPMTTDEAVRFLENIRSIPRGGSAIEALGNAKAALGESNGCVILAMPRNRGLWNNLEKGKNGDSYGVPLFWLDTTHLSTNAYIRGYGGNVLKLGGDPNELRETTLEVVAPDGSAATRQISAHEALRGELALELPTGTQPYFEIRCAGNITNAWQRFYARPGLPADDEINVVILREETSESLLVDRLMTAVVLSFKPSAKIIHLAPEDNQGLPRAHAVVIVGNPTIPPHLHPWMDRQRNEGTNFVCIPTPSQRSGSTSVRYLPTWDSPSVIVQTDLPLTIVDETALPMDNLSLLGIRELTITQRIGVRMAKQQTTILATRSGLGLLVMTPLGERSTLYALGFPLTTEQDGPVWHPVFPILINRIVFPQFSSSVGERKVYVGDRIRLTDWFDKEEIYGVLVEPDGNELEVRSTPGTPQIFAADKPGAYRLQQNEQTIVRVVNVPREEKPETFSRDTWNERDDLPDVAWVDKKPLKLAHRDFRPVKAEKQTLTKRKLDLSPIALLLLLGFMLFEAALVFVVWRREAVSV